MVQVISGSLDDAAFARGPAEQMFRLRGQIFGGRLGWDVQVRDGCETDGYDDAHSRYLLLAEGDTVIGGWRLRPTTQPYMLDEVFPQLLGGRRAPHHPRVWEVSRFAIDTRGDRSARFGFNQAARSLLAATAQYALDHGIERYVMVASAGAERLYRNAGLQVRRYGPPQRIGRVLSVAGWIDIDAHTCHVLLGHPLPLARAA
ncbi:MAG TPA: acyl-homoserine-lactone synthase [Nevskiaceae bacterium]|nr:acyl-homoserine-lactone synthase [Nevskiaceae bacterium]